MATMTSESTSLDPNQESEESVADATPPTQEQSTNEVVANESVPTEPPASEIEPVSEKPQELQKIDEPVSSDEMVITEQEIAPEPVEEKEVDQKMERYANISEQQEPTVNRLTLHSCTNNLSVHECGKYLH